jgi:hypothetical protein
VPDITDFASPSLQASPMQTLIIGLGFGNSHNATPLLVQTRVSQYLTVGSQAFLVSQVSSCPSSEILAAAVKGPWQDWLYESGNLTQELPEERPLLLDWDEKQSGTLIAEDPAVSYSVM